MKLTMLKIVTSVVAFGWGVSAGAKLYTSRSWFFAASRPRRTLIMRAASLLTWLLSLGLLAVVPAATAGASTTFNITGSGTVQIIAPDGTALPSTQALLAGTVTFTTIGSPDAVFDGGTGAYGASWVKSVYHLTWTGPNAGSFASSAVAGANSLDDSTSVFNNTIGGSGNLLDKLQQQNASYHIDGLFVSRKVAVLDRQTTRTDWLSSTAYPETVGLAPGDLFEAYNSLGILVDNYTQDPVTGAYTFGPGSYIGSFFLQSMTAVPPAVPEPSTWVMLLSGFCLTGVAARRRRATGMAEGLAET